ncbi:MAG: signal recognition particle-docking protein FtsY [Methanothrix sp.]|uniref:signal recognition particle-docking protein FtsY n=2 Tax=Methanothrix sp. TaxID=90426 RepID=UPI0025F26E16|nr:signal recognition particle-docking protein FtsY [Methanothrix sp.]MBK7385488.1 signal recognition particle-docking protein FtsY [Methanothrix sp.]
MFNRFKEKLSGYKEALSAKIAEKVSASGANKEPRPEEIEAEGRLALEAEGSSRKDSRSKGSGEGPRKKSPEESQREAEKAASLPSALEEPQAQAPDNEKADNKKSRFSFLQKAKTLVFEQEIILEEKDLEEPMWALEMALMESDVALPVAEEIVREVKSDLVGKKRKIGADTGQLAEDSLRSALITLLSRNHLDFDEYIRTKEKPVKILFVGVNGTGKTTSVAKVAKYLLDQGYSVVLAAGDTFRAGAIEQLEVHGNNLGLKVIKHKTGGDPAAVIFDAIEYSRAHNKDVVLADTAGRLHTNINLMDQMKKIVRVTNPDLLIFVDEAIAGNDAVERARLFNESVPIGGSILTKTDADAKGGSAISIAHVTGKPVLFLGVGQTYPDLVKFEPEWLVDRLMGEAEA